jgi:hypothetical protein
MLNLLALDDMGRAEGTRVGPWPGKGALLHQCSGEADFDGLPGDQLLPFEGIKRKLTQDAPAPPDQSED